VNQIRRCAKGLFGRFHDLLPTCRLQEAVPTARGEQVPFVAPWHCWAADLQVRDESPPSLSAGVPNLVAALSDSRNARARDNIPDLAEFVIRLLRTIRSNAEDVERSEFTCSQIGIPQSRSQHRFATWPSLTRITTRSLIVLRPGDAEQSPTTISNGKGQVSE
jgi:hypothetical protein